MENMDFRAVKHLDADNYLQVFARADVCFERGYGALLYDVCGKTYTDLFAGIAVTSLGHCHPAVTKAISDAANSLLHTSNLYYIRPQAELAGLIVRHSCADRVFIGNSGAEANEGAFKFARKYFYHKGEKRYEIISAVNSFHGRTLATLAATGQEKYQKPYRPLPPGFINVTYGDINAIKSAISPQTAAVVLETVQGEGGVVPGGGEYLRAVEALCRDEGVLLILDEIQTGMGRTGKLFSYEHFGIEPDIFTLAKALANGVPIGAIGMKQFVADAIQPGDHGSTFGGNPLACGAGAAVMTTMINENIPDRAAKLGEGMLSRLKALNNRAIRDVRGLGLLIGVELAEGAPVAAIVKKCLDAGYVVGSAARNTLRLAPPLVIDEGALYGFVPVLDDILSTEG